MKTIVKYLMILPLLVATSCLRESFEDFVPCLCEDEKDVMLKLSIPYVAPKGPVTRSIGASQENAIETLDVLAFKVDGGVETFQYRAKAKKEGNTEGVSIQAFAAKLRVKDYSQRFVLITNASSQIDALISGRNDGYVGEEKEEMLSQLTLDLNGGDRWKAISATNYTAIPMWGETAPKIIEATTTSISNDPIKVLRMIAKIDVQIDESVASLADVFKLKSVHVFNTNTSGRIVPKPGTEYVGADMIAKKASLTDPVTTMVGPVEYKDFGSPGVEDISMKGAIYLFETAAKNAGNPLNETCIVVGGVYDNDPNPTYYRLDFFAPDGTTHMDILRNHKYTFNITAVNGSGYASVDEAYKAPSFNMKTNFLVWDEGDIRYIYFDRQYMLGVNSDLFELDGETRDIDNTDNILKITTDHPGGWTASIWEDMAGTIPVSNDPLGSSPWFFIFQKSGAGGAQPDEMRLFLLPNWNGEPRTAYVHIKAGSLSCIVRVVQDILLPATITVNPNNVMLTDEAHHPAAQTLTVTAMKGADADPNAEWSLTSNQPWLTLSLNTDGSGASATVHGTGAQTVYLVATENMGATLRSAGINLNDGATVVTVIQGVSFEESIKVTPTSVTLPYTRQAPASQSLTVTAMKGGTSDPTAQWTLTSSQTWLWLTLNASGSGGGQTVNGTGSQTVYLVAGKNDDNALKSANIYLNGNSANVVTQVMQEYFNAIGETGPSIFRIYIEPNGGDPKLMLTQNPNNLAARFQFGGVRGWTMKTSGSAGNADYNPTTLPSGWNSSWQPAAASNYTVPHNLTSLRNGIGDPCRLVGYTQAEIKAAIDADNVPDNQVWRLPTGTQLYGYQDVSGGSNTTTFPRHGRIDNTGSFSSFDIGFYWSSWKSGGGSPSGTNAGYLHVSGSKYINGGSQASGMCITCVRQ